MTSSSWWRGSSSLGKAARQSGQELLCFFHMPRHCEWKYFLQQGQSSRFSWLSISQKQITQLVSSLSWTSLWPSAILAFSRRSNRQLAPCDLPQLIDQALEIAGNDFDLTESFDFKAIAIERDFDPQLGPVPATANELEQVLLNLLKNAAQAIHLRDDASEPGRITLRTRLNPPWAEVQVEDNGIGMPEPVRKRIFEPFFTTKEIGQGTGLGLSVAYFIITNNHKGQMEAQSSPGAGTCFTLRLPLQQTIAEQGT